MTKIGIVQLCCSLDKVKNLNVAARLVREAKENGARFIFFPECCDFVGRPCTNDAIEHSEFLEGETITQYCELARKESVWLSFGGFHEKIKNCSKIANTHVIINDDGRIVDTYRKIHLFDVDYDGGFRESSFTKRGENVVTVEKTPIGTVGITTCYDLRFPRLYEILRDKGADVLLAPSAFMMTTGKAHWEILLRARAIETQCFVVASAQAGKHNLDTTVLGKGFRESYGHSLVVDPFGEVLADLGTKAPCVRVVNLDLNNLPEIRRRMPIQSHRHIGENIMRKYQT